MTERPPDIPPAGPDPATNSRMLKGWLQQGLMGLLIIAAGIGGAAYFKKTAPQADKKPPAVVAPLVEVTTLAPDRHQVLVTAMGTVRPARVLTLKSRVTGEVTRLHPEFQAGGLLREGEEALEIDRGDYELALTRARSSVVEAEYALALEQGRQEIARREWSLLKGEGPAAPEDKELALRQPHLRKAQADLAAARANLEQARINLERTRIMVPFNAVVRSREIEVGSQVAIQEKLAELIGTDIYWIEVSVPVDRLAWIAIPRRADDSGAVAEVRNQNGIRVPGRVIRLLSDLETEGRMARLLVEVRNPLGIDRSGPAHPPLILGEYVRVHIQGRTLEGVFRIPRAALRDDARIWIAGSDGTLQIRSVTPLWRDAEYVLLDEGLANGDRLIVSDLPAAVDGMAVRMQADPQPPATVSGRPVDPMEDKAADEASQSGGPTP